MALFSFSGAPISQGATPYVDITSYDPYASPKSGAPTGPTTTRMEVARRDPIQDAQTTEAYYRTMAQQAASQQPQLATFALQGSGPTVAGMGSGGGSSSSANSLLSQYLSASGAGGGVGSAPTPPQYPTQPATPTFNASAGSAGSNQFSAQLQQLIAQLQGQSAESDSALRDRANQQIAAQRSVLDRRANEQVQRSLAANGVLPTGGLASRMREQISRPYEDQLAASSESINNDLRGQRNATANNLVSSLAGISNAQANAALDQQRLQQQAQLNQWQMQMDAYNAQVRQSDTAYSRALDAYNLNQQQQALQRAQQAQQQATYNTSMSGGAGGTSFGPSINAGQNSFLESGRQPEQTYALHQQIGRLTSGQVGDDYFSAGNQQLRAEQQQRAAQAQANRGNGLTSSGSNFNPNDPFGQTLASNSGGGMYNSGAGSGGGYGAGSGSGAYGAAMGVGSIVGGAAQQLGGTLGSYSNSSWGSSMY